MAGLPPASERGISQGPEMKPFWDVGVQSLKTVFSGEYIHHGGHNSSLMHPKLPVHIFWHSGSSENVRTAVHLRTAANSLQDEFKIDDSVVILEEGAITFVKSLTPLTGEKFISWVKVSRNESETHTKGFERVDDPNILEAARMAETLQVPEWNRIQPAA